MATLRMLVVACLLFALSPARAAGEPLGMVTIVDGSAMLVRGVERYTLVEGAVLQAADIIEVPDTAKVLQVEIFEGGVMQLGPGARLLLSGPQGQSEGSVYLLSGWLKVINTAGDKIYPTQIFMPALHILSRPGAVVVHSQDGESRAFAEAGDTEVAESLTANGRRLAAGQFYYSRDGRANRPSREFLSSVPAQLRDSLPLRLDRMRSKSVSLTRIADFGYDDVAAWLQSEPLLRPILLSLWSAKAADPEFRAALVQHMNLHPEWKSAVAHAGRSLATLSSKSRPVSP
jgi:hypothetical protein